MLPFRRWYVPKYPKTSPSLRLTLMLPSPDADTRMFSFSSLHTQSYLGWCSRRGEGLASCSSIEGRSRGSVGRCAGEQAWATSH